MDWSRLRQQIDGAWRESGRSQKEVLARANIKARQSINHWTNPKARNLPLLENLAAYADATEAQLIVELFPKGTQPKLIAVDEAMEEAARIIAALDTDPMIKERTLRFLRVVERFTLRDWSTLMGTVGEIEREIVGDHDEKTGG